MWVLVSTWITTCLLSRLSGSFLKDGAAPHHVTWIDGQSTDSRVRSAQRGAGEGPDRHDGEQAGEGDDHGEAEGGHDGGVGDSPDVVEARAGAVDEPVAHEGEGVGQGKHPG